MRTPSRAAIAALPFTQEVVKCAVFTSSRESLIGLVAMTVARGALAQATRSSVDIAASTGAPEFKRDPKTGQIWTPETVSQDGRPP